MTSFALDGRLDNDIANTQTDEANVRIKICVYCWTHVLI